MSVQIPRQTRSPTRRSPTRRSPTRRSPTRRSPTRRSPLEREGREQYDLYTPRKSPRRSPMYFKKNTPLKKQEQKYCKCVVHVAAKNDKECNIKKSFKIGSSCKNPYAICTSSTKRKGVVECGKHYNISTMPKKELNAYAQLKGVDTTNTSPRGVVNALNKKTKKMDLSRRESP